VLFDSYLPHRSGPNRSHAPRRALYVTYNRASEGDRRDEYFALKRASFPPECERAPGAALSEASRIFNLGNPIR
jgi:ectoine hydroxylase-related dioxygenase (phytanoyl-CoA dioxygenase family)